MSVASNSLREPDLRTEQWLSTVNRQGTMGIDSENSERQEWLKARAKALVPHARKGVADRNSSPFPCDAAKNDPFCGVDAMLDPAPRRGSSRSRKRGTKIVKTWLTQANFEKLASVSERELNDAVRSFSNFSPLEKISQAVLEAGGCQTPTLSFLLGTKAEEYLPEESFRQKAIKHYEIAAKCGTTDEPGARASYRYSLLQVWSDNCQAAFPYLSELANSAKTRDYRSRSLFWKYQCGTQIGSRDSKKAAKEARETLLTEFPFGLHSLLLTKDEPERMQALLNVSDSIARFRSQTKPSLNDTVQVAESLLAIRETSLARRVLNSIGPDADATEPEFQVYLASLFNRTGDFISKFRTLTVVFRDHPSVISRSALELYYPRKDLQMDAIRQSGVNELVVMSLIRQESAFNERARSPAGAMGLMQVMPRTARLVERGKRSNLFDPASNLRIGSKYFSFLLKQYDGDTELALAAYNAGPKRVEAWVKRYTVKERVLFLDLIPFRETREYVASIARNYYWYSTLYPDPLMEESESEKTPASSRGLASVFKIFGT